MQFLGHFGGEEKRAHNGAKLQAWETSLIPHGALSTAKHPGTPQAGGVQSTPGGWDSHNYCLGLMSSE